MYRRPKSNDSTRNLSGIINLYSQLARYKIDTKLIAFLNVNNKNAKKEAQKTPNSQSDSEQEEQSWWYHCP